MIALDERAFVAKLGTDLPAGWSLIGPDHLIEFDAVARSPEGNLFPIEVRAGCGLLDVSAVVDFGAEAETLAAAITDARVTPLIVTTQRVGRASADYASMLEVHVLEAVRTVDGQDADAARTLDHVLESLTSLDRQIESDKMVAAALTQEHDFDGWLMGLTAAQEDRLAVRSTGDAVVLSAIDPDARFEIFVAKDQNASWYVTAYAGIEVAQVQLVLLWADGAQASSELFELHGLIDVRTSIASPDRRDDPPAVIQVRRTAA